MEYLPPPPGFLRYIRRSSQAVLQGTSSIVENVASGNKEHNDRVLFSTNLTVIISISKI
jgi:hypothetical protein